MLMLSGSTNCRAYNIRTVTTARAPEKERCKDGIYKYAKKNV